MANSLRMAKPGNEWMTTDLEAYNIRVEFQDATTFFGIPRLPDPVLTSEEILEATGFNQATTEDGFTFLFGLNLAIYPSLNEESAVHDFVVALFHACGYTANRRFTQTRKDIRFLICGEDRYAKADACILDDKNEIILLVKETKSHFDDAYDPEPQLIVDAIAAFAANNDMREQKLCLPPCQSKVMPGITLNSTFPTFYKIPVSTDLVTAVEMGQYPEQETVVLAHRPAAPCSAHESLLGMQPLESRKRILPYFEAFKQFIN